MFLAGGRVNFLSPEVVLAKPGRVHNPKISAARSKESEHQGHLHAAPRIGRKKKN
jgi:hypothetical protein